ncbi:hypothetical protein [Gluconobacter oxydans]
MTRYTDADRRAWLAKRADAANWFDPNGYIDPQTAEAIDSLMRMEDRDE